MLGSEKHPRHLPRETIAHSPNASSNNHRSWFCLHVSPGLWQPPPKIINPDRSHAAPCQAPTRSVLLPGVALLGVHRTHPLLLQGWDGRSLCQLYRQGSKKQDSWTICLIKWGLCDIVGIRPINSSFSLSKKPSWNALHPLTMPPNTKITNETI